MIDLFKRTMAMSFEVRREKASIPELEKLGAFRTDVCQTFQEMANRALEGIGVEKIKWAAYGTDGPKSDIDLIAMLRGKHTAGELYLGTTLMDLFASELFGEETTTEHLFDWATYVGHHANKTSREDFHTEEAREQFDALNLGLALQQIQTNGTPEQWVDFKDKALKAINGPAHDRLRQAFENVDNFRNLQKAEEDEFAGAATGADKKRLKAVFTMMVNARAMAKCDQLEKAIERTEKPAVKDQLRLEWLANWAIVESKQEGGQLSSGAYHVICKDHGSQRFEKHLEKITKTHAGKGTDPEPHFRRLRESHGPSHPRDVLASMIENLGFYLEKGSVVDGSKYSHRTVAGARRIIGKDGTPLASWIEEAHELAEELLHVKREKSIPLRILAEKLGAKVADQLREIKDEVACKTMEQRREEMLEVVGSTDPETVELIDAYLPGNAGAVQKEAYQEIQAHHLSADLDQLEGSKQNLQGLVIEVMERTMNQAEFAAQCMPEVSMLHHFRKVLPQQG
jgi:hypothetical protein